MWMSICRYGKPQWSPDSLMVATLSDVNVVCIYDATTCQLVADLQAGHKLNELNGPANNRGVFDHQWSVDCTCLVSYRQTSVADGPDGPQKLKHLVLVTRWV